MSKINLPYQLRDGDKADASRLMANLEALASKMNDISLPGMPELDIEQALIQIKQMLDELAIVLTKTISS
jgi:hypothetical protein